MCYFEESNVSYWKKMLSRKLVKEIEEQNSSDIKFYSFNRKEAVVCCILKNDKEVGLGVSLKSPDDKFDEKFGRNRSAGRALKALINKGDSEPIRNNSKQIPDNWTKRKIEKILNFYNVFGYKSMYTNMTGVWKNLDDMKSYLNSFVRERNAA